MNLVTPLCAEAMNSDRPAGSAAEQHMHALLVEDKLAQAQSYVDWMTQLHKTVMAKA